jgi:hypothetical protein
MSTFANGLELNISDVVRLNFKEQNHHNVITEVANIVITYEMLKLMYQQMGTVIEQHNVKLAEIKKAN